MWLLSALEVFIDRADTSSAGLEKTTAEVACERGGCESAESSLGGEWCLLVDSFDVVRCWGYKSW